MKRAAALIGILALAACHHQPRLKSYPEIISIEKQDAEPDPDVQNIFERCKPKCMEKGKRVVEAWESATQWRCNCAPFDA